MQDVWADGQFRLLKGMECSYNSVTCCQVLCPFLGGRLFNNLCMNGLMIDFGFREF